MFRSNGFVAVEALNSMHCTFPVCFPRVGAVTSRQWSSSPRWCASHAPACCHAGLAMCRGNSHGRCRVRPPLLPCGRAALPPALRAAVLPSAPCLATRLLPLLSPLALVSMPQCSMPWPSLIPCTWLHPLSSHHWWRYSTWAGSAWTRACSFASG